MISNIRGERSRLDYTQDQLAEMLSVSPQLIRSWEAGAAKPSADALLAMSDVFGCTTDYLLGLTDERVGFSFTKKRLKPNPK